MILVLLGPPGVGKGTQAARIAAHYRMPAISTGAMFRDAAAQKTPFGRLLKGYLNRGEYLPDEMVINAVRGRICQPDCAGGFILDGFPRTPPQAEALDKLLTDMERRLTCAVDFEAPIAVLVKRFSGRRVCPVDGSTYHVVTQPAKDPGWCDLCHAKLVMRPDDAPDVVQRRLEVYAENTAPLLEYYREHSLLCSIDGTGDPETVFHQVIAVLSQRRCVADEDGDL